MPKPRLLPAILFIVIISTLVNSRLFVSQTLAAYFLFTLAATVFAVTNGILLLKTKHTLKLKPTIPTILFLLFTVNILISSILQTGGG